MKWSRIVRAGCSGGVIVAALLAAVGRMLDVTVPPWAWASMSPGWIGRTLEWGRTTLLLIPVLVVAALLIACVCALVFELVTGRAGVLRGAAAGLLCGVAAAEAVGLVPWLASWFAMTYAPPIRPIGAADPSWMLAAVAIAGLVIGIVAGAMYGLPIHASRAPRVVRWREIYREASHGDS
jgi:hypothetical protein